MAMSIFILRYICDYGNVVVLYRLMEMWWRLYVGRTAWSRGNVVETACGLDYLGLWKCGGDCMWTGLLEVVEMWWRLHVG